MNNVISSKKRERDEALLVEKEPISKNESPNKNDSKRFRTDNKRIEDGDLANGTHDKDETTPNIPPIDTKFMYKKDNALKEPAGSNKKKCFMIEQNENHKQEQQPLQWVCEYCEKALFDTRKEACDHEKTCPERPKLSKDEKRNEIPDKISSKNNAAPENCISRAQNEPRVRGTDKIQWVCEYCEDAVFDTYQGKCILFI